MHGGITLRRGRLHDRVFDDVRPVEDCTGRMSFEYRNAQILVEPVTLRMELRPWPRCHLPMQMCDSRRSSSTSASVNLAVRQADVVDGSRARVPHTPCRHGYRPVSSSVPRDGAQYGVGDLSASAAPFGRHLVQLRVLNRGCRSIPDRRIQGHAARMITKFGRATVSAPLTPPADPTQRPRPSHT